MPEDDRHFCSPIYLASRALDDGETRKRRLGRARELIEDCYMEPLRLEDLAASSFMSAYHFHREFQAQYGVTPHHMVTQRRMHRARQLLCHTSLSVTEVCMEVGFVSLGSFSSAFRKHTGYAPSHYRRRYIQVGWDPRAQIPACLYMIWGRGVIQSSKIGEARR